MNGDLDGFIAYDGNNGKTGGQGPTPMGGHGTVTSMVALQPPFQSGSTPSQQKRRYLSWNEIGCVLSRNEDAYCSIDIEFHDIMSRKNIHITDHYHFTMAALENHGAVFASPCTDTIPSTMSYRHPSSWTINSDWTIQCEGK